MFRGNLARSEEGPGGAADRGQQGPPHRIAGDARRPVRRVDRRARSARAARRTRPRLREGLPPQHPADARQRSQVTKVTTKMLTDLYGAHQKRGCRRAACTRSTPASRRCSPRRAGGDGGTRTRRSGPSRRRSRTSTPVVPDARRGPGADRRGRAVKATRSMARAIFVAATTGLRRAELCASAALARLRLGARPAASVGVDRACCRGDRSARSRPRTGGCGCSPSMTSRHRSCERRSQMVEERAARSPESSWSTTRTSSPTRPTARSRGSPTRSRSTSLGCGTRVGLEHLDFHYLRKFMETYGQEMGYSRVQVAMRAGHDPTVAAKHYSGRVSGNRPSLGQGGGFASSADRCLVRRSISEARRTDRTMRSAAVHRVGAEGQEECQTRAEVAQSLVRQITGISTVMARPVTSLAMQPRLIARRFERTRTQH